MLPATFTRNAIKDCLDPWRDYRNPKLKDGELLMHYGKFRMTAQALFWRVKRSSLRSDTALRNYVMRSETPQIRATPPFSKMEPSLLKVV